MQPIIVSHHHFARRFWAIIAAILALLCFLSALLIILDFHPQAQNAVNQQQRYSVNLKGETAWQGNFSTPLKSQMLPSSLDPLLPMSQAQPTEQDSDQQSSVGVMIDASDEVILTDTDTKNETIGDSVPSVTPPPDNEEPEPALARSESSAYVSSQAPLAAAPAPNLTEIIGDYKLPRISQTGDKPWQVYSKPFEVDGEKPLVGIIVTGLGLGRFTTESALNLPEEVTLSFSPYSKNAVMWGDHARNIGHEILVDLPQELQDYPASDPGPYGLINAVSGEANLDRLRWVMSRIPGIIGFTQNDDVAEASPTMDAAFADIAKRGLILVESARETSPRFSNMKENIGLISDNQTIKIDNILSDKLIRKKLETLEKKTKAHGTAIIVIRPYPIVFEVVEKWLKTLPDKNIQLAPISTIIARKND